MKFKDFLDVVCESNVIALYPDGSLDEDTLEMHSAKYFRQYHKYHDRNVFQIINNHYDMEEFTVILEKENLKKEVIKCQEH